MADSIIDDMRHQYMQNRKERHLLAAFFLMIFQWALILFSLGIDHVSDSFQRTGYVFKMIFRSMKRHKSFTLINIAGLTLGISVAMLILIYLRFELSYDGWHVNAHRIVRVTRRYDTPSGYRPHFARCPDAFINQLPQDFPEIEELIRFQYELEINLQIGENKLKADHWFTTDARVFDVFTFPLIHGDSSTALTQPNSIVLSKKAAIEHFGTTQVIGKKILRIREGAGEHQLYTITGVMDDLPPNSHFHIDYLASYRRMEDRTGWAWIYLLLKPGANIDSLESKMPEFIERHAHPDVAAVSFLHLQSLRDIHLHSHLDREIEPNGDIRYIYIFSAVAVMVLLIAIFNFMTLSTARTMKRVKEVEIRRVLGASRKHLISFFLWESLLHSYIALILGIIAVINILPLFCSFLHQPLVYARLINAPLLFSFIGLATVMGLLAGIYPALLFTASIPVSTHTRRMRPGLDQRFNSGFRKTLVVFQFTISIALIICTIISALQFDFLSQTQLGSRDDQVAVVRNISNSVRQRFHVLRDEWRKGSGIMDVASSMDMPSRDILDAGFSRVEGIGDDVNPPAVSFQSVSSNYFQFMNIPVVAGKSFYEHRYSWPDNYEMQTLQPYISNKKRTYMINESALSVFGWSSPQEALGKRLDWRNNTFQTQTGEIVGVVRDFHYTSLRLKIKPLLFVNEPFFNGNLLVKIDPSQTKRAIAHMEKVWDALFPDLPLTIEFLDDLFAQLYRVEESQGRILTFFSALGVFIAYLGLFGLSAYSAEQRVREMGIRKVLGASARSIFILFTLQFLRWIVLASLFSIPLACWFIHRWLQGFAYRIALPLWPFFTSVIFALVISLVTLLHQSVKTASANLIDTLRSES